MCGGMFVIHTNRGLKISYQQIRKTTRNFGGDREISQEKISGREATMFQQWAKIKK
jgi:hypothetical protein